LIADEEKDMKKLARLAKEGWIFEKCAFMEYKDWFIRDCLI
jgi:hypothetical protein